MRRLKEMALRGRFNRVSTFALLITLVVAGALVMLYDRQVFQSQKVREVSGQAAILAATVTAALMFDDAMVAQEYVTALKVNPEIDAVGVYSADGRLVAHFLRPGAQPLSPTPTLGPPRLDGDFVSVSMPVSEDGAVLGSIYLRSTVEALPRRLIRYGVIALLLAIGTVAITVLATAHTALSRANTELEERASQLAAANTALQNEIAEREKAEDALRQSQKMEAVGRLSGGIAHDFNNLLTAVRGNMQLLQKRFGASMGDAGAYIQAAQEGLERASNLTQRILAFSRQQALSPRPTSLNRLIKGMGDLLRHSVGETIVVETDLDHDEWPALCDTNQMENCILNLAINARDAMPNGGKLILRTGKRHVERTPDLPQGLQPGDYTTLEVRDTGIGMSAEIREKAFEPFFTTKPPGQGTGLGLSMVFGFIKQSNGYVSIDSEPGRGTAITLMMPRADGALPPDPDAVEPAAQPPSVPAPPTADGNTPILLLVEDEVIVRMVAVEALRDEGYTVIEAGDGQDALEIIESDQRIDMLCTDVRLPGMNGYQLAEAGLKRRPGLKVLLMTGYSKDPLPRELAASGIQTLGKPFDLDHLTRLVAQVLKTEKNQRV